MLHALTSAHSRRIPFENLDILLGRPMVLDYEALFDKLIERRRGGYCFEMNGLFLHVLRALGFDAVALSARVRLDRPRDYIPPRGHMFLRVLLDGASWLTDVAVGAASLAAAIRCEPGVAQITPHDARRLVREDGRFLHQIRYGADWHDVYEFSDEEMPEIDREVASWYTSTHPNSLFKQRLWVARAGDAGRRFTLLDNELEIREAEGHATSQLLATPLQLLAAMERHFGLQFEPGHQLRASLEHMTRPK